MELEQNQLQKAILNERRKIRNKRLGYFMVSILSILVVLSIWECSVRFGIVKTQYVEAPSDVLRVILEKFTVRSPDGATLPVHIMSSLQIALAGFFLAVLIGTPLGLIMGWYKSADLFIRPIFNLIRPIPAVSWIPLMIVLLGIGLAPKVFIVFLSAFVPAVLNSYAGIKLTNQAMINVAKTCGAKNIIIFFRVGLPSAMPMIFTGWKVGLGLSWSTLVAAEMLASNSGLGYMILTGRQFLRIDIIMGGMIVIGLIGLLLFAILSWIEKIVLRWRL